MPANNSPEVGGGPPSPGRTQDGDKEESQPGPGPPALNLAEEEEETDDDWPPGAAALIPLCFGQGEGAKRPAWRTAEEMIEARQQHPPPRAPNRRKAQERQPGEQPRRQPRPASGSGGCPNRAMEKALPPPPGQADKRNSGWQAAAVRQVKTARMPKSRHQSGPAGPPRTQSQAGDSKMAEMTRRNCAFCPDDEPFAIMYISEEQNLTVHQNCLLFSSGFAELAKQNSEDLDKRFDVTSVRKEIRRGRKLHCSKCQKRGATIGCEVKACRKCYHYICALRDGASMETDEQGYYRLFCSNHKAKRSHADDEDNENEMSLVIPESSSTTTVLCDGCQKRGSTIGYKINTSALRDDASMETNEDLFCSNLIPTKRSRVDDEDSENEMSLFIPKSSSTTIRMNDETVGEENMELNRENHDQPKERIEFLKKCKQAELLNKILEKMLNTLHLAQEKLMDDNTSEAEYEETVTLLFDCGLFENIRRAALSETEGKLEELTNTRNSLDAKIERLKALKEFSGSEDNTSYLSITHHL